MLISNCLSTNALNAISSILSTDDYANISIFEVGLANEVAVEFIDQLKTIDGRIQYIISSSVTLVAFKAEQGLLLQALEMASDSLVTIVLSQCTLFVDNAHTLRPSLYRKLIYCNNVTIDKCGLTDKVYSMFCNSVFSMQSIPTCMKKLDISHNQLTSNCAEYIVNTLQHCILETLIISNNKVYRNTITNSIINDYYSGKKILNLVVGIPLIIINNIVSQSEMKVFSMVLLRNCIIDDQLSLFRSIVLKYQIVNCLFHFFKNIVLFNTGAIFQNLLMHNVEFELYFIEPCLRDTVVLDICQYFCAYLKKKVTYICITEKKLLSNCSDHWLIKKFLENPAIDQLQLTGCSDPLDQLTALSDLHKHWELVNFTGCNIAYRECLKLQKCFMNKESTISSSNLSHNKLSVELALLLAVFILKCRVNVIDISHNELLDVDLIHAIATAQENSPENHDLFCSIIFNNYTTSLIIHSSSTCSTKDMMNIPSHLTNIAVINTQFDTHDALFDNINHKSHLFFYDSFYQFQHMKEAIQDLSYSNLYIEQQGLEYENALTDCRMIYSIVGSKDDTFHLEAAVQATVEIPVIMTSVFSKCQKKHKLDFTAIRNFKLVIKIAQELLSNGTLHMFEITDCHIADDVAKDMATIIITNETIEFIKLSNINAESLSLICEALTHLTSLEYFNVDSCSIDRSAGNFTASLISSNTALQQIAISNCNTNNIITEEICRALKSVTSMTDLALNFICVSDAAVNELANTFQSNASSLKKIKLCKFQASHINMIASSLKNVTFTDILLNKRTSFKDSLQIHQMLEKSPILSLDFSGCELEELEFINILNSLVPNTALKTMNLSFNIITAKVAFHLARVLHSCNHIESLTLLYCKLNRVVMVDILMSLTDKESLQCIELNFKCDTSDKPSTDPANLFASILVNNKCIQRIVLPNCNDAEMISALYKLSSLHHLDVHSSKVVTPTLAYIINNNVASRYLDISNCGIPYKHLNDIFNSMSSLRSLEHLKISGNIIANVDTLVHVIKANVKLRHLNISHCQIDASNLVVIFKALQDNKCLSYFDVSYSFVVKMADTKLAKVFHNNKIITHLLLSYCVFELQSFSKLVPPLKLFDCLMQLDLSSTVNVQCLADDISDVIESNKMLQHLNLSNCKLSALHLMKITSSIMKLSMLKHLDISCNEITDEDAVVIAPAITNNQSLQHLLLNNQDSLRAASKAETRAAYNKLRDHYVRVLQERTLSNSAVL